MRLDTPKRGLSVLATLLVALSLLSPATAMAGQVIATIDSRAPELKEDPGGGWSTEIGITNLTDGSLTLAVTAKDTKGGACEPELDKSAVVKPAEHSSVEVTIPQACAVDKSFAFAVTATAAEGNQRFDISSSIKPVEKGSTSWIALIAFPIAFVLGLLALFCVRLLYAEGSNSKTPLTHLDATWSFDESIMTNLTAAGGLLTTFFATSGVVEGLLGVEEASKLPLLIVGGAIAVALNAASPVVLQATRTDKDKDHPREQAFTVGGLLTAIAVGLAAATGLLWVGLVTGLQIGMGFWGEFSLCVLFGVALLLVVVYVARNTQRTLCLGLTKPPTEKPTDGEQALQLLVILLKRMVSTDEQREAIDHKLAQLDHSEFRAMSGERGSMEGATEMKQVSGIPEEKVDQALLAVGMIGALSTALAPQEPTAKSVALM